MKNYKAGPGRLFSGLLIKSFFIVVEFDGLQGVLEETRTLPLLYGEWDIGKRVDFAPLVAVGLRYRLLIFYKIMMWSTLSVNTKYDG